jgi:hypothetical protein
MHTCIALGDTSTLIAKQKNSSLKTVRQWPSTQKPIQRSKQGGAVVRGPLIKRPGSEERRRDDAKRTKTVQSLRDGIMSQVAAEPLPREYRSSKCVYVSEIFSKKKPGVVC